MSHGVAFILGLNKPIWAWLFSMSVTMCLYSDDDSEGETEAQYTDSAFAIKSYAHVQKHTSCSMVRTVIQQHSHTHG